MSISLTGITSLNDFSYFQNKVPRLYIHDLLYDVLYSFSDGPQSSVGPVVLTVYQKKCLRIIS